MMFSEGLGEHGGKYIYKNNIILSSVDEN